MATKRLGEQAILNRIKRINSIDEQIAILSDEKEKLRSELKDDMTAKGIDECPIGRFTMWIQTSDRTTTDTARLKQTYEDLCDKYNVRKEVFVKVTPVTSFRITERKH